MQGFYYTLSKVLNSFPFLSKVLVELKEKKSVYGLYKNNL
jgi:hypothetical protein